MSSSWPSWRWPLRRPAGGRTAEAHGELVTRALEGYYDVIVDHLAVFRLVETDRSVRSHPDAGHRLADQAARFLAILAATAQHDDKVRAAAAVGAIRRSLQLPDVRPARDRRLILACARAALSAEL